MSQKQAAPTQPHVEAEEQSSSAPAETEVTDEINPAQLSAEHEQLKQQQKDRIEKIDKETLQKLLYQMILVRRFEEKCAESYSLGKIGGFCHLYIGQEAVAVGAISRAPAGRLRLDELSRTRARHRQRHVAGCSDGGAIRQGRQDVRKVKAARCTCSMQDVNFLGGHAIVGGQIPLATGVAFGTKYKGTDQVTLCFFGEAAVNQGAFHESLNMAQLWRLPCIYICENNQYGMGTSLAARDVVAGRVAESMRLRNGFGIC